MYQTTRKAMRGLMSLSLKPGILSTLKRKLYLSDNKKAMRGLMSLNLKPGILSKLKRKLYLYLSDNKKAMRDVMSLSLKPDPLLKLKRKLYLSDNKISNERFSAIEPNAWSSVKIKEETISIIN